MSTTISVTRTPTQRAADALKLVSERLSLEDVKRLGAALNEVAVEWVLYNSTFADEIRAKYEGMVPPRPVRQPAQTKKATQQRSSRSKPDVELIPLKEISGVLNPAAPPDPYFLLDLYGMEQLPLALARYTKPRLQEAVKSVQARHGGTKPHGTTMQHLIDYIVEYVAIA